ncbi:nucleotide-diphospho-sugar transferase, partial [Fomitiporia mediterranea MF3/22]|uniref:nucleotide-diphospho-sugar transferase n=1 Tax=Fomitiporia mediterranea (strain MF3/22) TaxID=694068 RepID=UPI0004408F05
YTAVVLYLVQLSRFHDLLLSLSLLYKNVKMQTWPILLMHTDDFNDPATRTEFMIRLYDSIGGGQEARWFVDRIEWIKLEWTWPESISHDKSVVQPAFEHAWPGYHQMCAFFATQIFDHPRLKDVTYYMRLDTDSYIFKPLCYDPVELFHQHNKTYAHNAQRMDPDWVTVGLWNFVDDYARTHSKVEQNLEKNGWKWPANRNREEMGKHQFPIYYNNFEIVKVDAFRRPDIRAWFDELTSVPERFLKYRWGDAPLRYATISMFFDVEKDVEEFCGMDYWHNGIHGNKCSC